MNEPVIFFSSSFYNRPYEPRAAEINYLLRIQPVQYRVMMEARKIKEQK